MAEGFVNSMLADNLQAYSAGINPSKPDPLAVEVMAELGIDISKHQAKTVDALSAINFNYVISVCDAGHAECPYVPASKANLHHEFPDPPALTAGMTDSNMKLEIYRSVRDEIRSFVQNLHIQLGNSWES